MSSVDVFSIFLRRVYFQRQKENKKNINNKKYSNFVQIEIDLLASPSKFIHESETEKKTV